VSQSIQTRVKQSDFGFASVCCNVKRPARHDRLTQRVSLWCCLLASLTLIGCVGDKVFSLIVNVEDDKGAPIPNAILTLSDQSNTLQDETYSTGEVDGKYLFEQVHYGDPTGTKQIRFTCKAEGFESCDITVPITGDDLKTITIRLKRAGQTDEEEP
jgi:hypothetical protein